MAAAVVPSATAPRGYDPNSRDSYGKDTMTELDIYLRREAAPERWPKLCKLAEAALPGLPTADSIS